MVVVTSFKYIIAVAGVVTLTVAFQTPLQAATSLFSPRFSSFIDEIRRNGSIPGISVGVVRLGEDKQPIVQLGSWGQKTEGGNGHDLTVDVRSHPIS